MDRNIDLISQPKKSFWKLSIPILALFVFNTFYGIIDMLWVSQLSKEGFFAVGAVIPLFTLINALGFSIGEGSNSIMSRFVGFGDYESSYNSFIHGIAICIIVSLIIAFLSMEMNEILNLMSLKHHTDLIKTYFIPLMIFSFVFIMSNFLSETFQVEGDSKTPTILFVITNILNIILDPIFMFVLGLGLEGLAYATILASAINFVSLLSFYLLKKTKIPLDYKYFKFNWHIIREILVVAIPKLLNGSLWCFSAIFINNILIAQIGIIGVNLFAVSDKIQTFLISPIRAYGKSMRTVVAHLFGAKKIDELRDMYIYTIKVSVSLSVVIAGVFLLFRKNIYESFAIINMETSVFWIAIFITIIVIATPFSLISSNLLDGLGKSYYSLFFTLVKIAIQLGLITLIQDYFSRGMCVFIGICITELIFVIVYPGLLELLIRKYKNQNIEDIKVV